MIVNVASVILTFGLVFVTYLYMRHTKRLADETKRMADIMIKQTEETGKMADMMVRQTEETAKMAEIMVREYKLKISPPIELKLVEKSEGQITLKLFYRGNYPVTIEKVILEWWFRDKEGKTWSFKPHEVNEILKKENPIAIPFVYNVEDLRKEEYPKSKEMRRDELLRSVDGKICLSYSDSYGNNYEQIKDIKSLIP